MNKGGLVAAWLFGTAIVVWRDVHVQHRIPAPGQFLGITGLFLALGALAEYTPAVGLATAMAWGLDVAALFNVLPAGLGAQVEQVGAVQSKGGAVTGRAGEGGSAAGEGNLGPVLG